MAIFESNNGGKLPLTWVQTRNMPLTYRVCTSHTILVYVCLETDKKEVQLTVYMYDSGHTGELEDGKHHILYI